MKDLIFPILGGAAAGAAVGFLAYGVLRVAIDRQVAATIQREVPPQVRAELDHKLADLGITPQVASQIRSLVSGLDQAGVFRALQTTPAAPTRGFTGTSFRGTLVRA